MLKIGDFSKLARISIRMLRHYDEIGLLKPEKIDSVSGYRYYSEAQLPLAGRISALKMMGFSLSMVSEILQSYEEPETLKEFLVLKREELQEQADELNQRLLLLDNTIQLLRKDDEMMKYDVTLKAMPQRYVASVRQIIPAYDREGVLWELLYKETAGMNLQQDDPCYGLALFYDEGHKDQDVDVEIQIAVKGSYEDTEHVKFKTMPQCQIASATYKGSYERLTEVNLAVANWVRDNGYEFDGTSFCIYHVSPSETQNPEELVTEVCFPVKKK